MAKNKSQRGFPPEPGPVRVSRASALNPSWQDILKQRWHLWLTFVLVVLGSAIVWSWSFSGLDVEELEVEIVAVYPHDTSAFTQGLLYHDGYLYESTGQVGQSTLRKVEIETGKPIVTVPLREDLFGEGLAMVGDQFFQITWKAGVGFIYNKDLQPVKQFDYSGQGWGLAFDGKHLIMSDGAAVLRYFDPQTMEEVDSKFVMYGATRIDQINEMEFVDGVIYANRWRQDVIYLIDAMTGQIKAKVLPTDLLKPGERPTGSDDGSLNGIAYNPDKGTFYITGKKWPKLFEVRFKSKSTSAKSAPAK